MKITREQLRNIVGEVLQEEKDYESFFKAMLKKHGVSSPDEFESDEEKKAFFNKVEDTWKGVSERLVQLKEDELTAKQQKIDLNKNGKVDGDDLSKLRAGAKTEGEGEEPTSLTKILSKEGETLVKSGAGKMYNITKVNESKESDILAKIEKLRLDAEAGKIKTLDQFLDKFKPLQKQLKALGEALVGGQKKLDVDKDGDIEADDLADLRAGKKVNEGKYDADLDKIEAAVKGATSFMNVGSELKKVGIKYDFTTSMIPMYMIKVSGNTIAIVNKKYAAGAEKTVGDIAIGLLN
jgi:hypothetical protein